MKLVAPLLAAALTGCAGFGDISPEQAAVLMNMQHTQQANNAAMWQNMQSNPVYQRQQPLYTAPAPQPRPVTRCVTTNSGYSLYTTCQ
jgi:hypothetical protein